MMAILNIPRRRDSRGRFVSSKANMDGALRCDECGGIGTHRWECSHRDIDRLNVSMSEKQWLDQRKLILDKYGIDPSSTLWADSGVDVEALMPSKPSGTITQEWVTVTRRGGSGVITHEYLIHPTKPTAIQNPIKKWVLWGDTIWDIELFPIKPQSSSEEKPDEQLNTSPEYEEATKICEEIDNELAEKGTSEKDPVSSPKMPVWLIYTLVVGGFFILKKMFE
ncbi:MAG: hypothetical protein FWC98_05625 [Bacteroidales bacterium]|nr:hypothetical protein [Bacteroidales bacterium]